MKRTDFSLQSSGFRSKRGTASLLLRGMHAFCCVLLILCCSQGLADAKEDGDQGLGEITSIEILDYAVKIKVSGPLKYSIDTRADPFRIAVDLEGVRLGSFRQKLFSYKAGITEITPTQIETPRILSRLDILLQAPFAVKDEIQDNTLVLTLNQKPVENKETISLTEEPRKVDLAEDTGQSSSTGGAVPSAKATEKKMDTTVFAGRINEVLFEKAEGGIDLVIKGDGKIPEPALLQADGKIVIDVPGVEMGASLPTSLPPLVKNIKYSVEKNALRFTVYVAGMVEIESFSLDDELVISLAARETKEKGAAAKREEKGEKLKDLSNLLINFDFQDADVVPILRTLADFANENGYDINIVIHPDVKGKIPNMKLKNVPWDQALDLVLKTFNLDKNVEGNVIRIAPTAVFTKERQEKKSLRSAEIESEASVTRIFLINYADSTLVEKTIKDSKILTSKGSLSFDKRTSAMVVNDVPSVFPQVEKLLADLDKATPQVLIEARIIETTATALKDLGIQWGVNYKSPNTLMSVGGLSGNPALGTGPFTGKNFIVDFPSGNVKAGGGSGITFGLLNPSGTLGLDLQLSALETVQKGRIVSSPRIVTTDNEKATILQGTSEPYPVISTGTAANNITTAFKDVALSIEVTPHITPDGSVTMLITVKKEDILAFVNIGGSQVPRTSKLESTTKVLVESGSTVVIGGVVKRTDKDTKTGLPGAMRLPILGWLFKNETVNEELDEFVIFITPRILEKQL